jgi:lipopolysaccharide biosynthesis glycosyltransferase
MSDATPEPIVLACAADDAFAMPLTVALRSVLDTLSPAHALEIFVLDGGIREENRERLAASLDPGRARLRFVAPPPEALAKIRHRGRTSLVTYFRILAADLLPAELRRAIYLDADVVAVADLSRLWAEPLRGAPVLAVRDAGAPTVSSPRGLLNYRELGLAPDLPYFNAGVMSLDLACWREEKLGARLLAYLETHAGAIRWWDQDALNGVLAGRWGELDPRWNQIPQCWEPAAGEGDPFPPALRERVIRDPWIVHFSTWSKPWHWGCKHPARERFFEVLDRTAWAGWRPRRSFRDSLVWRRWLGLRRRLQALRLARGAGPPPEARSA